MDSLTRHVEIQLPNVLFLKNPKDSDIGQRILLESAAMIAEIGIDAFNFKKLALKCKCTEATVYRYFENKHKLLLYFLNIYWGWLEYRLVMNTQNISDSGKRLKKAIALLAHPEIPESYNEEFGKNIIAIAVQEGIKIHLTHAVKTEISDGSLTIYQTLVSRFSNLISAKLPGYLYADSLAASILDNAFQQMYFQKYYPSFCSNIQDEEHLKSFLLSLIPKSA